MRNDADQSDPDATEQALSALLSTDDGRERKARLKEVLPLLGPDHLARVAPLVRDRSPRVASRVTAYLAKHGADELFEAQLEGLKPGKVSLLRGQFARQRRDPAP